MGDARLLFKLPMISVAWAAPRSTVEYCIDVIFACFVEKFDASNVA